jgi:hypothetical protein
VHLLISPLYGVFVPIPESGTDAILVARRETSGEVDSLHRSGEAPKYFQVRRMNRIRPSDKYIGASLLRNFSPPIPGVKTPGHPNYIRSGLYCARPKIVRLCYGCARRSLQTASRWKQGSSLARCLRMLQGWSLAPNTTQSGDCAEPQNQPARSIKRRATGRSSVLDSERDTA